MQPATRALSPPLALGRDALAWRQLPDGRHDVQCRRAAGAAACSRPGEVIAVSFMPG